MRTPEQIQERADSLLPGSLISVTQEEYNAWVQAGKLLVGGRRFKIAGAGEAQDNQAAAPKDVNATLNDRAKTHGSFIDNGHIMQMLKFDMREYGKNWDKLPPHQREALEMIQHKIGRILSGNPNEPDHWRDIAGYATLVENILTTGQSHVPSTTK